MTSLDVVALYEDILSAAMLKLQAAQAQNWDEFAHYDESIADKVFIIGQAPVDLRFDAQQDGRKRNAIEQTLAVEAQSLVLAKARMSMLAAMIDTTAKHRQILDGYGGTAPDVT